MELKNPDKMSERELRLEVKENRKKIAELEREKAEMIEELNERWQGRKRS